MDELLRENLGKTVKYNKFLINKEILVKNKQKDFDIYKRIGSKLSGTKFEGFGIKIQAHFFGCRGIKRQIAEIEALLVNKKDNWG